MIKELKVYLDTSVIIALTDSLDIFHKQSVSFVNRLITYRIERLSGSPLIIEIGKLVETKETKRCLDMINAMEEFGIQLKSMDMKQVWKLSETYIQENVLTKRHRLDLLHYASASLLGCTHVASWDNKQFNYKISKKISSANVKHGLSSLLAGKPEYIMSQEND
jgi:predicted nucleic acid-binding protein